MLWTEVALALEGLKGFIDPDKNVQGVWRIYPYRYLGIATFKFYDKISIFPKQYNILMTLPASQEPNFVKLSTVISLINS